MLRRTCTKLSAHANTSTRILCDCERFLSMCGVLLFVCVLAASVCVYVLWAYCIYMFWACTHLRLCMYVFGLCLYVCVSWASFPLFYGCVVRIIHTKCHLLKTNASATDICWPIHYCTFICVCACVCTCVCTCICLYVYARTCASTCVCVSYPTDFCNPRIGVLSFMSMYVHVSTLACGPPPDLELELKFTWLL